MRHRWIFVFCALTTGLLGFAPARTYQAPDPSTFVTYQFVLISRSGKPRPMGERQIQQTQERRLDYVAQLIEQGKLIAEGPVTGAGSLRSVLILRASADEAQRIVAADPWVQAGNFQVEIHPWTTPPDMLDPPQSVLRQEWVFLGLLRRPPGAPELSEEELDELQKGHLEHVGWMADSGELVAAGPMADDGVLRGIFIFRESDPRRIRKMVDRDPSVRAGRLSVELLAWRIPSGVIPAR